MSIAIDSTVDFGRVFTVDGDKTEFICCYVIFGDKDMALVMGEGDCGNRCLFEYTRVTFKIPLTKEREAIAELVKKHKEQMSFSFNGQEN